MKREGRQHGMVRAFPIPPPPWVPSSGRIINRFDSPSTAGLFTRVPAKPTNHSKFTSRCGRPISASKSKAKAKGSHKVRASDLTVNHRLVSWTVGNGGRGFDFSGISATAMLGHLDQFDRFDGFDDDDYEDDDDDDQIVQDSVGYDAQFGELGFGEPGFGELGELGELGFDEAELGELGELGFDEAEVGELGELGFDEAELGQLGFVGGEVGIDDCDDDEEENEDAMSFCDVGFVMEDEIDGDGEWCVVGEL